MRGENQGGDWDPEAPTAFGLGLGSVRISFSWHPEKPFVKVGNRLSLVSSSSLSYNLLTFAPTILGEKMYKLVHSARSWIFRKIEFGKTSLGEGQNLLSPGASQRTFLPYLNRHQQNIYVQVTLLLTSNKTKIRAKIPFRGKQTFSFF